jgi:hypothetical protein
MIPLDMNLGGVFILGSCLCIRDEGKVVYENGRRRDKDSILFFVAIYFRLRPYTSIPYSLHALFTTKTITISDIYSVDEKEKSYKRNLPGKGIILFT